MLGTRANWEWGEGRGYRQYKRVGFSSVTAAVEESREICCKESVLSEISVGGD